MTEAELKQEIVREWSKDGLIDCPLSDEDRKDIELLMSDRLMITADTLDELDGVNIVEIINELREHPDLTIELDRWQATLCSKVANDVLTQGQYPCWVTSAVEEHDTCESDGMFEGTWVLG